MISPIEGAISASPAPSARVFSVRSRASATRVVPDALDPEFEGARARSDELPTQTEAELRAGLRGEERAARAPQVPQRIHVGAAVRMHLEMQVRVAAGVARVAVPGDLLPAETRAPFGTANVTFLTQPPLLSFRPVRSLFRWMYRYIVPLRP